MQKQYISIGNEDIHNGQYMLTVFKLIPYGDQTLAEAASELAAESSNGTSIMVGTGTPFSNTMGAIIYKLDEEKQLVYIAYPWRIFDRGGNIQNILTFVAGNIFGMSNIAGCKLLDVHFPTEMLSKYDGPNVNLDDLRKYLQVFDRPILGTIIKPKIGLTATEYAEICYDFWIGGGDFVKNDEPQANQDFCPYNQMVDGIRSAMDRAEFETGRTKIHSFNVSSPDFDTMIERADYIQSKMKPGSYAFLVDGITSGWTAVQTIRRRYPNVFLHFHRAGHGAFTRKENPFGFTVSVMTKFARLAGASGIHTGTAGVGKMDGTPHEDVMAINHCLKIKSQGDFFEQVWATIPEKDSDIQVMIDSEEKIAQAGPRELSLLRKEALKLETHSIAKKADWRTMNSSVPIISGGLNPTLLAQFIEVSGTIDFITTMGGGVHSHPMQTQAGAKALLEACHAWQDGKTLKEAAHDGVGNDVELDSAIRFFDKKGAQATRVEQVIKK